VTKRAGLTERPVQRGAIRLLTMRGYECVHVPNGAHLSGGRLARIKQMAALKADGLRVGFPDLVVFGKRPLLVGFMECKREQGGVVSDEQYEWRDRLQLLGFPWALINQPEAALAAVKEWGWE
jgi:hypothetical protein